MSFPGKPVSKPERDDVVWTAGDTTPRGWPHSSPSPNRHPLIIGMSIVAVLALIAGAGVAYWQLRAHQSAVTQHHRHPAPPLDRVPGPAVPASGAYVGAWSKPTRFTDEGRRQAISDLETGMHRKLDIVHTYRLWNEDFPTSSDLDFIKRGYLMQLSWADPSTGWKSVTSGRYDDLIRTRARAVKAIGRPVFMEWRWEMDRPNLQVMGTAPEFVAAWRHIKAIFNKEQVTNAGWVWCPTAEGFAAGRAAAYYPGDKWVDWTCVDAYPGPQWTSMTDVLAPFLAWANQHPKPIMIGEFGVPRDRRSQARVTYLKAAEATFKDNPQIKAVSYFDSNPAGHAAKRAYQLTDDPAAIKQFGGLAGDPYFNPQRLRVG